MAFLPSTPLTLTGGCFCSAIRYTISIPDISARPLLPNALPTPISKESSVPTRLPTIDLDHCNSCRRAGGALIQCWFICPQSWNKFALKPRASASASQDASPSKMTEYSTAEVVNPSSAILEATHLGHYNSSPDAQRTFCTRCGTQLAFYYSGERPATWTLPPIVDMTLGSLDRESLEMEGVRPDRHSWWSDGVGWVQRLLREGDVSVFEGGLVRHPTGAASKVVEGH